MEGMSVSCGTERTEVAQEGRGRQGKQHWPGHGCCLFRSGRKQVNRREALVVASAISSRGGGRWQGSWGACGERRRSEGLRGV